MKLLPWCSFDRRVAAVAADRAACNERVERRQTRGDREVARVQQNLRRYGLTVGA